MPPPSPLNTALGGGSEKLPTQNSYGRALSRKAVCILLCHCPVPCLYTQDSSAILGGGERRRTRSQTRKVSESGEEEKKPPVKRTGTMEQTIKVLSCL